MARNKPKLDPDERIGFCSECREPCEAILVDFGIGPYEFQGTKGIDEDWKWVSPCCEAEVIDSFEEEDDDCDNGS